MEDKAVRGREDKAVVAAAKVKAKVKAEGKAEVKDKAAGAVGKGQADRAADVAVRDRVEWDQAVVRAADKVRAAAVRAVGEAPEAVAVQAPVVVVQVAEAARRVRAAAARGVEVAAATTVPD